MCNFSDFIEQRGIEEGLEQGMEEGLKKGLLQGKAEGKEEGKAESRVEVTLPYVEKLMQRINASAVDVTNMLDVEEGIRPAILQPLRLS